MVVLRMWLKFFVASAFIFEPDSLTRVVYILLPYLAVDVWIILRMPFKRRRVMHAFLTTQVAMIIGDN